MLMPQFHDLYQTVVNRGLVERFGSKKTDKEGHEIPPNEDDFWFYYLAQLLHRIPRTDDWRNHFDAWYSPWEAAIYAEDGTWDVVAPIRNFSMTIPMAPLPNGVVIRQIMPDELSYLSEAPQRRPTPPDHLVESATYVLSHALRWPKAGGQPGVLEHPAFDDAITALRLLKPSSPFYGLVMVKVTGPSFGTQAPIGSIGSGWSSDRSRVWGPELVLHNGDMPRLASLVDGMSWARTHLQVSRAADRFNFSHERRRAEDKLVDCWVGLESLFLKREEQAELSYRAALRASRFIGTAGASRRWVFALTRGSYDARSRVVHGEPAPKYLYSLTEFAGELLRMTIQKCLTSLNAPDLERLDSEIASGD